MVPFEVIARVVERPGTLGGAGGSDEENEDGRAPEADSAGVLKGMLGGSGAALEETLAELVG